MLKATQVLFIIISIYSIHSLSLDVDRANNISNMFDAGANITCGNSKHISINWGWSRSDDTLIDPRGNPFVPISVCSLEK